MSYRERPVLQRVNSQPVMLNTVGAIELPNAALPPLPAKPTTAGTQSRRLPPQRIPIKPVNPNMQSLRGSIDTTGSSPPPTAGSINGRNTIVIPKDIKLQQQPPKQLPPLPPKPTGSPASPALPPKPTSSPASPALPSKPRDSNTMGINTYLNSQPLIVPARKLPAAPSPATQPVFSKVAQRASATEKTEESLELPKAGESEAVGEIASSNDRIFASPERLNEIKSRISLAVENNVAMTLAKFAKPSQGPTQEDLDLLNYTGEEDQQVLPSPPTSPVLDRNADDELGGRQRSSTNPSKSIRFRKKTNPQNLSVPKKTPERTASQSEMIVMGAWEKQNSNSLVKQLQKEAQKMEKEKVEITNKSKTQESENVRLSKWRKLLERVQEEDMAEIRKLEETVASASREKAMYENSCKLIEKQCADLLELLQDAVHDLKFNINR